LDLNNNSYAGDVVDSLEAIYEEFRKVLKKQASNLVSLVPKTLAIFVKTTSSDDVWYNLSPQTKVIENINFIKTWFLQIMNNNTIKPFYQSHFLSNPGKTLE
jgi:hypothetical protein